MNVTLLASNRPSRRLAGRRAAARYAVLRRLCRVLAGSLAVGVVLIGWPAASDEIATSLQLVKQPPGAPAAPSILPPAVSPPAMPAPPAAPSTSTGSGADADAPLKLDFGLIPITGLTTNIVPGQGELPARRDPADELRGPVAEAQVQRGRGEYLFAWEASAFCNQPLYFEQPNLERYGYSYGIWQPVVSGAQFFLTVPILPYKMAVNRPRECIYSLGYYRPGSYAPYQINWIPLRLNAAVVEGGFATALVFLIP